MAENENAEKTRKPYTKKTTAQKIKDIQQKIKEENKRHEAAVKKFEQQIEELKKPKMTKAQKEKAIMDALKKQFSIEELAAKAGLDVAKILGGDKTDQEAPAESEGGETPTEGEGNE